MILNAKDQSIVEAMNYYRNYLSLSGDTYNVVTQSDGTKDITITADQLVTVKSEHADLYNAELAKHSQACLDRKATLDALESVGVPINGFRLEVVLVEPILSFYSHYDPDSQADLFAAFLAVSGVQVDVNSSIANDMVQVINDSNYANLIDTTGTAQDVLTQYNLYRPHYDVPVFTL